MSSFTGLVTGFSVKSDIFQLNHFCSSVGTVEDIKYLSDVEVLVTYSSAAQATAAVTKLPEKSFKGTQLTVTVMLRQTSSLPSVPSCS